MEPPFACTPFTVSKFARGIEVPERLPVAGGYGAQHPVHAAGDENPGDNTYGCNYAAMLLRSVRSLPRRKPLLHAIGQAKSDKAVTPMQPEIRVLAIHGSPEYDLPRPASDASRHILLPDG